MRQLQQDLSNGKTYIIESPTPILNDECLLISTRCSLISAGTERMLIEFSRSNLLDKARQQPEKVRQVIEKIGTDGIFPTLDAINAKMSQPISLGYSNVGVVKEIGKNVNGFNIGDRVVSSSVHADIVSSPANFAAKIPDNVSDEEASFTVVGSIAIQGIRLAKPEIGETFVVIGVGLIGQIAAQILVANGCKVIVADYDSTKLDMLASFGVDVFDLSSGGDFDTYVRSLTKGVGADGVLVCAATKLSDPMNTAADISRMRGRVIQIGVTGLDLKRSEFYAKELQLSVSCSFGPGRYDPVYAESGLDYPIGFVRWTAQRNFNAILDLLSNKKLSVDYLCGSKFSFLDAHKAYEALVTDSKSMGTVLLYDSPDEGRMLSSVVLNNASEFFPDIANIAFIGAGNYASRVLIPAFKSSSANLHTIVSSGGVSSAQHGKKFGFLKATSDVESIMSDDEINTIVIATRHDTHADIAIKGLLAGKNIFVEKPLALDFESIAEVEKAYYAHDDALNRPRLMVGFNRRFSPHVKKAMELLKGRNGPISLIITINSGYIPPDHWLQNREVGGGRIVGEACHFVDLMRYIVGHKIQSVSAFAMGDIGQSRSGEDKASITLTFEDGSIGTVHYFANGANSFPKERVEVFSDGKTLQIDNYRKMKGYGFKGFGKFNLWRQDKGQIACAHAFSDCIKNGKPSPIPVDQIFEVSNAVIEAVQKIRDQA
jgi:predicted dehydrogenase/threonine dehydrogenase-like Zn-dependent dehydrogenase